MTLWLALAITTWTSALASATTAIDRSAPVRTAATLLVGGVRHGWRVAANMRAGRLFRDCPGRVAGNHSMLIQAVELAALLNPLLRPWASTVRFAAERAADVRAATGVVLG